MRTDERASSTMIRAAGLLPVALVLALASIACRPDVAHEVGADLADEVAADVVDEVGAGWPGWRGPARDGRSSEAALQEQWPEGGPPLLWRTTGLGSGFSSLAVADGRIFTLGDVGEEQHVVAVSSDDGSILWRTVIGPSWSEADLYPGSRSTPSVAGDTVYALGTEGDLVALAGDSGVVRWRRSLAEMGGFVAMASAGVNWRFTESPLVDGDRVVVTPGAPDAAMVALDRHSGEVLWRASIPDLGDLGSDGAAYSSIVISHGAGVKQYVQLMGRGVVGVRAADGRFLWGYNRIANDVANIPTPLVEGDHVFTSTGYDTGAALLELRPGGDGPDGALVEAHEVYFLEASTFQNHHGGMVLHDGFVYTGTGHNRGFPLGLELRTGTVAWGPVRNEGRGSAALAYADGRLYFRYQDGLVVLVEATPEAYRERGSFRIPEVRDPSWSHPVVSGGRLYLREQDRLYVYDLRRGNDEA
jgi:outer membrane protein assembly factor BamB